MNTPLDRFLGTFPATSAHLASLLRKEVLALFSDAVVTMDEHNLGFGHGERYSELVFVVSPNKSHVNLGFAGGASLPDPAGLLEGTGKVHRHVIIRSEEEIQRTELQSLMLAALERSRWPGR